MTFFTKLSALTGASALVAAGLVAFAGQSASAADFGIAWDANYYLPGDTATLTTTGCAAGNTVEFFLPGGEDPVEVTVPEDGNVAAETIEIPEDVAGVLGATATCTTPGEGDEPDQTVQAEAEAHILDQQLKAVPSEFTLGEAVTLTAGEFVPGAKVTLRVNTLDGEQTLWSHEMGDAGEDLLAVSDVTFPTSLECGTYSVLVSSSGAEVDNSVEADLVLCGATPSPSPSPSVSPSVKPSATPTGKPQTPGLPNAGL